MLSSRVDRQWFEYQELFRLLLRDLRHQRARRQFSLLRGLRKNRFRSTKKQQKIARTTRTPKLNTILIKQISCTHGGWPRAMRRLSNPRQPLVEFHELKHR